MDNTKALYVFDKCMEAAEIQMEWSFAELCNNLPVVEAFAHIRNLLKPPSPDTAAHFKHSPDLEQNQADGAATRKDAGGAAVSPAQEPCQTCGGDCADANPPVVFCPNRGGKGKRCGSNAVKGV